VAAATAADARCERPELFIAAHGRRIRAAGDNGDFQIRAPLWPPLADDQVAALLRGC
jgi:hypothetical protein